MTGPDPKPVPMFTWVADDMSARGVFARLSGVGNDTEYVMYWGDHQSDLAYGNRTIRKSTPYPAPGAYMLTARDKLDRTKVLAQDQVVIREGTVVGGITFTADPNNLHRIHATFSEVAPEGIVPRLSIDWGDGRDPDVVWALPGESVSRLLAPGTYTRTVGDLGTKRWLRESYTVDQDHSDPDGTFTHVAGDAMTVRFTVTSVSSAKKINVDWGAGEGTSIDSPKVGSTLDYTYPFAGEFLPWVSFADGTGRPFGGYVKVPFESVDEQ